MYALTVEANRRPARSNNNVRDLYSWVRAAILNGKMEAGEQINQAQLSQEFGVSRTPLREALRMLQAEGLVEGELNQKMRVSALTAEDIDSLYAARIMLETLGLGLTVPRLTQDEITTIQQTLKYMNGHSWAGERVAWEEQHNAFHGLLVMHIETVLGPMLAETVANLQLRAERYRRLYVNSDPRAATIAAQDHARIVDAITARDAPGAIKALTEHLGRTALRLLARRAPGYEAKALRNATELVRSGDGAALAAAMAVGSRTMIAAGRGSQTPIDL